MACAKSFVKPCGYLQVKRKENISTPHSTWLPKTMSSRNWAKESDTPSLRCVSRSVVICRVKRKENTSTRHVSWHDSNHVTINSSKYNVTPYSTRLPKAMSKHEIEGILGG